MARSLRRDDRAAASRLHSGAFVRGENSPSGKLLLKLCWLSAAVFWAVCGWGFFSELLVQPRLYLSLFPGIALLSAYGFEGLWKIRLPVFRLGAAAAVLAALVFAFSWPASANPGSHPAFRVTCPGPGPGPNIWKRIWAGMPGRWNSHGRSRKDRACSFYGSRARFFAGRPAWRTRPSTLVPGDAERADGGGNPGPLAGGGWTHILLFHAGADFERAHRGEYAEADWGELDRLRALLPVAERFGTGTRCIRWNKWILSGSGIVIPAPALAKQGCTKRESSAFYCK